MGRTKKADVVPDVETTKTEEIVELTEKEILSELSTLLIKEKTLDSLSEKFSKSELEIMYYITKLKEKGINISYSEKNGKAYVVINNHPDLAKENEYRIQEEAENTKVAVISDLRFGSKFEQISILNDMYRKFAEEGVKYVIVAGNLIEGKYSKKDALEFGQSLLTNDEIAQADHLIEFFPRVEGITTLFITGKNEHKSTDKINIGQYIASQREDMVYLGPKSCKLYFNNVSFKVEQLKKGNKAYTVAYPPQQYSRAMASYEDYDAIILGGTQSEQHFPAIRDTQIFTAPSVVGRTPKMADEYEQNVISALILDVHYTKTGKLKRLVPEFTPHYKPSTSNYLTVPKLNIKRNEENNFVNIKENLKNSHAYFGTLEKIYSRIKKEEKFNDLKDRLGISSEELFGIITILQEYGREIDIVEINNELVVRKYFQKRKHSEVKPPKEELHKKEFLVVSDTHYGSIWCQPSFVTTAAYEAYNRGITIAFHVGDISDGDYHDIRINHPDETFKHGYSSNLEYSSRVLPKFPGLEWKGIIGSHDYSYNHHYPKVDFGKDLAELRSDFEYLGPDKAFYNFDNCKIELFHPGGGTSRILSTKPQNGIDQMASNTKPNLRLTGHYHKVYYFLYRNIHTFLLPCNVDQSSFMMKNEIPNLMGNYFITIWYDDLGDIHYIQEEPMIFRQEEVIPFHPDGPLDEPVNKKLPNRILTLHK